MSLRASDRESCHKSGIVLTCYVDGHKRFRTVPLSAFTDRAPPDDGEAAPVEDPRAAAHHVALEAKAGRSN